MAISGKCYMSLHQYNHSANRGDCLQACRRPYLVTEKETGKELEIDNEFIMSPKDLSTIAILDQIIEAGVQILKIEGRGRPAEYVKTVTTCYHEAVDAIISGEFIKPNIERWQSELAMVYNRGFWEGYYLGKTMGEWNDTYGSKSKKVKIYLGKGLNYFRKVRAAEFLIETNSLLTGDEIIISGPTTGVIQARVNEIRIDDSTVIKAKKGDHITIPVDHPVRRSDKLYKLVRREE
jgi:putative protease